MPKILTVGSEEFDFPLQGENAGYGEQITDWAEAVSDALATVEQPNDITRTSATILNNQSSPVSIAGFLFDSAEVLSFQATYVVVITTSSPATQVTESGTILGNYTGSDWVIAQQNVGTSGVAFDITAGGQVQYTSSNVAGSGYVGTIVFSAKVINESV